GSGRRLERTGKCRFPAVTPWRLRGPQRRMRDTLGDSVTGGGESDASPYRWSGYRLESMAVWTHDWLPRVGRALDARLRAVGRPVGWGELHHGLKCIAGGYPAGQIWTHPFQKLGCFRASNRELCTKLFPI